MVAPYRGAFKGLDTGFRKLKQCIIIPNIFSNCPKNVPNISQKNMFQIVSKCSKSVPKCSQNVPKTFKNMSNKICFKQVISFFHYLEQKVPGFAEIKPCANGVPCSAEYINWLGFITIPFLALVAFTLIALLMLLIRRPKNN